jgi:hypothetical protein
MPSDAPTVDIQPGDRDKKFLLDPYLDWAAEQKIPVHQDFGLDFFECKTDHWALYEAKGAFMHVHGRGDFVSTFALEIAPGKKTKPINHMFEIVVYVIDGNGSTTIDVPGGKKHTFEWGPKSLFSIPLNCRYQHFNGSGKDRALLACTHDLPLVMNLFHSHAFVFDNPFVFSDRIGDPKFFEGEGEFLPMRPGRHMWETNYVPDLTNFDLVQWDARGKGSSNICFILAEGTMHAHVSEIPAARYKKGHRHGNGVHIFAVTGSGYSLLWNEGEQDFIRIPWRHGVMYAPPHWVFHQHFNTAPEPARYLASCIGSRRYPFSTMRRNGAAREVDLSVKQGGRQIEYEDQDPRLHRIWLDEIAKTGVQSVMGDVFDEAALRA